MKSLANYKNRILFFFTMIITSTVTFAQVKKPDIYISLNKKAEWYHQPLVWLAGIIFIIAVLAGLLRNTRRL